MSASGKRYSDKYFLRAGEILKAEARDPQVLMQVFCRTNGKLCGLTEVLALFADLDVPDRAGLRLSGLTDGDLISPWETVLTIEGPYASFAHLETLMLGVLARGTRIATQTSDIVAAAEGRRVLFFGARHDHYLTQKADGYAATIGGAVGVSTDAQGERVGWEGIGTVPHALIAAYEGDTVLASRKFVEVFGPSVPFVALVDFDNDCVGTSVRVAQALGDRLQGVRLDTSASLVDIAFETEPDAEPGVSPALVKRVRAALDAEGYADVDIIVSGGITAARVKRFLSEGAPVNAFGVGSAILRNDGRFDFTADIVQVDGRSISKVGRAHKPNPRLRPLTLQSP